LEGVVRREVGRWGEGKGMITIADIRGEMKKLGKSMGNANGTVSDDEEAEMARMLDEKVGSV
jgi:hypothetical protein